MKVADKNVCAFLAIAVIVRLTACGSKSFEHQKLIEFCIREDCVESPDFDEYYKSYRRLSSGNEDENGAYFAGTGEDAQDIYDYTLNLFGGLPPCSVEEASSFIFSDDDGIGAGFLFTLKDPEEAEKLFAEYKNAYMEEGSDGKEIGYEYCIEAEELKNGRTDVNCAYLKNNSVLLLKCISRDTGSARNFCKTFGVRSPI